MTYAQFHIYFTIPLFALSVALNFKNPGLFQRTSWLAIATLLTLAVGYTTPWDSYLIQSEIWSYAPENVIGTFLWIPFEEYFFFMIQTLIGCMVTLRLLKGTSPADQAYAPGRLEKASVVLIATALILPIIYAPLYVNFPNPMRYFYLITGWGAPILLLQWGIGYRTLLRHKSVLFWGTVPLTLYLWVADGIAIQKGIWFFPGKQTSGLHIGPTLPFEEALFFLFTTLMVVQGFILFTQFSKKELPVRLGGTPYR